MTYSAQGRGFFGVVSGSANWNDNILNYDKYLESVGNKIQLKTGFSFNMNAETHISMRYTSSSTQGKIFLYRLSNTTDRDFMGQYGAYSGSAATYSDDRAIETSNSNFDLSIYVSAGTGTVVYIPESCCTIIFFYKN
tara:strand:+ start:1442 stop:1852 length:411 start_codon:yes stop_codon:yes gene_type:complete